MITLTRRSLVLGATAVPFARSAHAQTGAGNVTRIVVPFPPGGTVDPIARMVQPGLQQRLGTTIIIENKPGAGTTVGDTAAWPRTQNALRSCRHRTPSSDVMTRIVFVFFSTSR